MAAGKKFCAVDAIVTLDGSLRKFITRKKPSRRGRLFNESTFLPFNFASYTWRFH